LIVLIPYVHRSAIPKGSSRKTTKAQKQLLD
jgi:hypothetical protein